MYMIIASLMQRFDFPGVILLQKFLNLTDVPRINTLPILNVFIPHRPIGH